MAKIDSVNEAAGSVESGPAQDQRGDRPADVLLREIAHDLNNMLTVLLGNLELLERDATLRAVVKASIGDMVTAAQQGPPLVDRLRTLAQRVASGDRVEARDVEVDDAVTSTPAAAVSTAPVSSAAVRRRILYLDDDAPLVSLAVGALTELGHSVSGFVRSRDALAALKADTNAFDLVVTDYTMPGMSGLDFARAVAALRSDLPVVLMSGAIGEELRSDCERLGLWEVMEKPVSMRELCVRIHAAATRSAGG